MTDKHDDTRPRGTAVERERRLAQALRDNLRRRKDQARSRAGDRPAPVAGGDPDTDDSDGGTRSG
jgi:hypothetical protein